MEKQVFRNFMSNDIIPKTIIFADTLGLDIDNWKPAQDTSEKFPYSPYRMYFYHKNQIVGYIDSSVMELGNHFYPQNNYPFTLFTPLGNITGTYGSWEELFSYQLKIQGKEEFDILKGLFQIKTIKDENNHKKYLIGSYLKFEKDGKMITRTAINNCASNAILSIENYKTAEKVEYFNHYDFSIYHEKRSEKQQYENICKIYIPNCLFKEEEKPADFTFTKQQKQYKKRVLKDSWYHNSQIKDKVDFNIINKEISDFDNRLFDFITEEREKMILETDFGSISLYDNMINICLGQQLAINLARAKKNKSKLKNNKILQKMKNYQPTKKY